MNELHAIANKKKASSQLPQLSLIKNFTSSVVSQKSCLDPVSSAIIKFGFINLIQITNGIPCKRAPYFLAGLPSDLLHPVSVNPRRISWPPTFWSRVFSARALRGLHVYIDVIRALAGDVMKFPFRHRKHWPSNTLDSVFYYEIILLWYNIIEWKYLVFDCNR